MKRMWFFLDLIISALIGYYINFNLTSKIMVDVLPPGLQVYLLVFVLCLALQMMIVFTITRFYRNKKIDKITLRILFVLYALLMIVFLFGRQSFDTSINLNPINLFLLENKLTQNVLNILLFLPIGYLIKNIKSRKMAVYALGGILLIELLQLITKRGTFDINDIILNMLAIGIGYYVSRRFKLKLATN